MEWDLLHLAGKLPLGWKDSHGAILKTKIRQVLGCGIIGDSHVVDPDRTGDRTDSKGQDVGRR